MINNITTVRVGQVWNSGSGATLKDNILADPDLGQEIDLKSPLKADLMLVRMKDGLIAVFSDFSADVEQTCARCTDKFIQQIRVETFERQFLGEKPFQGFDPLETFLVDQKDMTIDLTESLRQEIILHFPLIPVCSERCQGLCTSCAANLNHEPHKPGCELAKKNSVQEVSSETHKPFANLKDLLNQ